MQKLLTVSIAAYNVEKYLRECLDSFTSNEARENCEVLIVNDGSTDNTAEIAQTYIERYPETFRLIDKPNGGWGSTLNVGIAEAKGKYFKQLDGDDLFDADGLAKFLNVLENFDCDLIITNYLSFCDGTNKVVKTYTYENICKANFALGIEDIDTSTLIQMHGCTFLTELLKKNNIRVTEHCFYTDAEFIIKAISFCKTAAFCDCVVYRYRVSRDGQSMSLAGFEKHYPEYLRVLKTVTDFVQTPERYMVIESRIQGLIIMEYLILLWLRPKKKHYYELKEYDAWLKNAYPQYYHKVDSKKVAVLRNTKFFAYPLVSYLARKQYFKDHQN